MCVGPLSATHQSAPDRDTLMRRYSLLALLLATLSTPALANTHASITATENTDEAEAPASPWNGSGELGYASARGNSTSESLNARFNVQYVQGDWIHAMDLFGLRTSAEYQTQDEDGVTSTQRQNTANRHTLGFNSALQMGEHRQFTTALRLESDDFATYAWQQSASVGYGSRVMEGERTRLDIQVGPGFRRAHHVEDNRIESGLIGRGFVGLSFNLTENTELANTLLVESGKYNTFAQNELGVSVAMNSHLALKAGLQARHNSVVEDQRKKTDTLTTMNVVYKFR